MHRTLLSFDLHSISAETKFFLIRFVQLYGVIQPMRMGVKELAKATGATDRVVSRSLDDLVELELLDRRRIDNGARGRNKREHQCSSRLIKLLEDMRKNTSLTHEHRIDHVLNGASQPEGSELNITNRLLLVVLLSQADQFGIVRSLGLSDLSKRTGLNRERVKAQLHKLHSLGVIRTSVAGMSSAEIFRPAKSIYFLNLHACTLKLGDQTAIILVLPSDTGHYLNDMNEAMRIVHLASIGRGREFPSMTGILRLLPDNTHFKTLAALFYPKIKGLQLIPFLQAKLDEYASFLISKYRHTIFFDSPFLDHELLEIIRADFKPPTSEGARRLSSAAQDYENPILVDFLYKVSFRLASELKEVFSIEKMPFEKIDFQILPNSDTAYRLGKHSRPRTLLAIPHNATSKGACYVLKKIEGGALGYIRFENEENIQREDRYKYGLLTKTNATKRYVLRS